MSIAIRGSTGALRQVAALSMRDGGGTLRKAAVIKMRDASNVLRTIFSSASADANPNSVSGYASAEGSQTVTTNSSAATAIGGTAPFSYLWEAVEAAGWTISSPTAAATTFVSPSIDPYEGAEGTFRCKITDATGAEAYTGTVFAHVFNLGSSGTISGGDIP